MEEDGNEIATDQDETATATATRQTARQARAAANKRARPSDI